MFDKYLMVPTAFDKLLTAPTLRQPKKRKARLLRTDKRAVTHMHISAHARTTYSTSTSCARAALHLPL